MEISGVVHEVGQTQQVSDKFKKRELVVIYSENPSYPEYLKFEAHQDKCENLDELREGDEVTVNFNLRGKPWTDKTGKKSYFNSMQIWKFNINRTSAAKTEYASPVDISSAPGEDDDLPF